MASFPSILCYSALLVLSLTHFYSSNVEGGMEENYHVVDVRSLLPGDVCSSSAKDHKGGLTVSHRHGPCSPLPRRPKPNHGQILTHDEARVASLHRRRRGDGDYATASHRATQHKPPSAAASAIPASSGIPLGTGNYVVTVGFGTPRRDLTVAFDTGSDVTWIQCQPCVSYCYAQQDPIFDPSRSSTYLNISCSSPFCAELDASSCSSSTCLYAVQYGDNSYTVGFFARDTLTLGAGDVIPNFRFGCGEKNRGLFGKSAGLLGLGREPVSLVSQSAAKYGRAFSYCLPATSSSTGYLAFGSKPYSNMKYTPMRSESSSPSFYFLDLEAIIVGGKPLPIAASVFSNAGTLIDSGTVISRLPPDAYSALRSAFRKLMTGYPTAPALSILDTCYDLSGESTVSVPTIALQFGGGVMVSVDFNGILYIVNASQACLAFAGNSDATDFGIIGNTQQRRLNVVYDVAKAVIGFGPGGC